MQNNDSWDKKNIAKVNVESHSYTEALKKAAELFDVFITFFQDKDTCNFKFFIKARFEEDENVEHLWIIPISYNNEVFIGTINNEPNKLKNVAFGSKVKLWLSHA